jgi:hypothetical protein
MESRKRFGDVVQVVGQKYYPCTLSDQFLAFLDECSLLE